MVEQITFQVIFQFLQTVSIMVGMAYYLLILNSQQKNQQITLDTRRASLFMQLYNNTIKEDVNKKWNESMALPYQDYDAFGPLNEDVLVLLHTTWQKYNGIGHLLMQGLIDSESAYHYAEGYRSVLLWMKWENLIKQMREQVFNPDYMNGFQYMAEKMMEYRDEKGLPTKIPEPFTQ